MQLYVPTGTVDIADLNSRVIPQTSQALTRQLGSPGAGQIDPGEVRHQVLGALNSGKLTVTITPQPQAVPQQGSLASTDALFPNQSPAVAAGGQGGGGQQSAVDTPSLSAFADWLESDPIPAIQTAIGKLQAIQVKASGLPSGIAVNTKMLGGGATVVDGGAVGGVAGDNLTLLQKLSSGLQSLASDMRSISSTFQNADDLNKATADQLQSVMGDVNGLVSDAGGTVPVPGLPGVPAQGSPATSPSSSAAPATSASSSAATSAAPSGS
jgi:hypothetical protein